jgi:hypothetical protein
LRVSALAQRLTFKRLHQIERGWQIQTRFSGLRISREDSTTPPCFATLTVITDHGKRPQHVCCA